MPNNHNEDMLKSLEEMFSIKVESAENLIYDYLTADETNLISRIKKGECLSYAVSVHKIKSRSTPHEVFSGYNRFIHENAYMKTVFRYKGIKEPRKCIFAKCDETFPIRDVSMESQGEQIRLVRNTAAAIVRKKFDIEKNKVVLINAFKVGEEDYIVVVGRYTWLIPDKISGMSICLKIFGGKSYASASDEALNPRVVLSYNDQLHKENLIYWRDFYGANSKYLRNTESMFRDRIKESQSCSRLIDKNIADYINSFSKVNKINKRIILIVAAARAYVAVIKERAFLIPVEIEGEELSCAPVFYDSSWDTMEAIKCIDKQYTAHKAHSYIKQSEVETIFRGSLNKYFWICQSFHDYTVVDSVFDNGEVSDISLNKKRERFLLEIEYSLDDGMPSVLYTLGRSFPDGTVDAIHKRIEAEIGSIVGPAVKKEAQNKKTISPRVETTDSKTNNKPGATLPKPMEVLSKISVKSMGDIDNEIYVQTAIYLKKSKLFEGISPDKLIEFAKHCKLDAYVADDEVISSGDVVDSLYIVGKGQIEESHTNGDGYIRSLGIYGDMSYLGSTCLLDNNISNTTWTVFSREARIVEIPRDKLIALFNKYPGCYRQFINKQEKRIEGFMKLWMID